MTSEQYTEYLRSPEWKQRSAVAKKRAGYKCQICSARALLQVHHNTYEHLGDEPPEDLFAVCDDCHILISRRAKLNAPTSAVCEWPAYLQKIHEEEDRPRARILARLEAAGRAAAEKAPRESSDGTRSYAQPENQLEQTSQRPLV